MERIRDPGNLESILSSYDTDAPRREAISLSREWYNDPDILNLERQHVFWKTWQPVGVAQMLRTPGSYQTASIAGAEVMMIRGKDNVLRAMPNVCTHRSALLIDETRDQLAKIPHCIVCPYHHWTFRDDGTNQSAPEADGAASGRNLRQLPVREWGPFVWVNGDPNAPDFEETAGDMVRKIDGNALASMEYGGAWVYDVACNWKVFVDNYEDGGYHVGAVHPELSGALAQGDYRSHTYAQTNVQTSGLQQSTDGAVAKVRSGTMAQYWWGFPNWMINAYDGGNMDMNLVLPTGQDTCRVWFHYYFDKSWDAGRRAESIKLAHKVQLQDQGICERVQKGMRGPFYGGGQYARVETPAHHWHRLLAQRLRVTAGTRNSGQGL